MIRMFSLYDDSFCDLLCLIFCTVKTHLERMAIEHEYLHHRGKTLTLAKTQSFFKLVLFTSAFPSKPCHLGKYSLQGQISWDSTRAVKCPCYPQNRGETMGRFLPRAMVGAHPASSSGEERVAYAAAQGDSRPRRNWRFYLLSSVSRWVPNEDALAGERIKGRAIANRLGNWRKWKTGRRQGFR